MLKLDLDYLKRNGFKKVDGDDESFESCMIDKFGFIDGGVCDARQCRLVRAQFGDRLADVESLFFNVRPMNDTEYDVAMIWNIRDGAVPRTKLSSAAGEDLYTLVSYAIVGAHVEEI